jgi:hypothetical protein
LLLSIRALLPQASKKESAFYSKGNIFVAKAIFLCKKSGEKW